MAVIYLVRHGQASWGAKVYDKLSELGVRQSARLGEALKQRLPRVDRVVRGSLVRHQETADACLAALGTDAPVEVDARWNEYDHRDLLERHKPAYRSRILMNFDLVRTGNPRRAFQNVFDQALVRWLEGGDDYREPWAAFSQRACGALADLAAGLDSAQTALVFTSGGPISAVAANLLQGGADTWLSLNRVAINTGVTKVVIGRRGTTLVTYNDHAHLEGAERELLTYR
ncbi:MAG: histidine phosphatase family protein [Micromonosporaceae bacterium]